MINFLPFWKIWFKIVHFFLMSDFFNFSKKIKLIELKKPILIEFLQWFVLNASHEKGKGVVSHAFHAFWTPSEKNLSISKII